MATCGICGNPAGIFRSFHKECLHAQTEAIFEIEGILQGFVGIRDHATANPKALKFAIDKRAVAARLDATRYREAILTGFSGAIDTAVKSNLSGVGLVRVQQIMDQFDLQPDEMQHLGATEKLVKALTLKDLRAGVIRSRCKVETALNIVMGADETILWAFSPVGRLEPEMRVSYEGRSQGVSVRIARGLWYRTGASRGQRIENTELSIKGMGGLVITNKNIHFISPAGNFRLPMSSISSVEKRDDAVCFVPKRGKKQWFHNVDVDFAAELVLAAGALL